MYRRHAIVLLVLVAISVTVHAGVGSANMIDRPRDPVIMQGLQLPGLTGLAPNSIVAFRYQSGWAQIPVQIDERFVNDYGNVYGSTPVGFARLGYADDGTFMGPDPNSSFDSDDELVFMARDTGERSVTGTHPSGVVPATRTEILITDPLSANVDYVYLYQTDGSLTPDAGIDYVTYDFVLLSGDYLTTYNTQNGPNPEDSEIVTAYYRTHFGDRWTRDELNVFAGAATGVDVLDRHKNLFAPGNCQRSDQTFSNGEGAFFTNKDGPVRAIRSYMGANSGPLTQRDHFFYERRHDVCTYLRVHAIPGVTDFYDYGPNATGLTYYNDLNASGVTIDGNPTETVTLGPIVWEMVSGAQGTLIYALSLTTDIPGLAHTSYYLDDSSPSIQQCTGDGFAFGSSGVRVDEPVANTDPVFSPPPFYNLSVDRVVYMEAPDQSVSTAEQRHSQATNPLAASVVVTTAVTTPPQVLGYRLSQNHPNPFEVRTQIEFATPRGQRTSIRVFDVAGRLVKVLYDRESNGHGGVVSWDGTDLGGKRVASGVYFYRLQSASFGHTRKMVLID